MEPLVSVIIPTYNRAKYIDRAIMSVLDQTYNNIELIIVDDNGDETEARAKMEEKMKKYLQNPKIHYLKHKINKNGAAARNTGIAYAKGKYIAFLDDDDFYFNDRVEISVKDLEDNRDFDAVYTSCVIYENDRIKKINIANIEGNCQYEMLRQIPFFSTGSNMFFRAEALKEINGFNVSFKRHQDLEVMVRYFEKFLIKCEKKILVAKCEEDKANFPNIDNAIKYKIHFLNCFKEIINSFDSEKKMMIYHDNYYNLLKNAVRFKNKNAQFKIKKILDEQKIKLTFNDKLKLFIEKTNTVLDFAQLYRIIKIKFNSNSNELKVIYDEKKRRGNCDE